MSRPSIAAAGVGGGPLGGVAAALEGELAAQDAVLDSLHSTVSRLSALSEAVHGEIAAQDALLQGIEGTVAGADAGLESATRRARAAAEAAARRSASAAARFNACLVVLGALGLAFILLVILG